jgi:Protein of unknown function (DUF3160)
MMWFGRMPLLLGGGGQGWRVSEVRAHQQTMAAALIAQALPATTLADGRSARTVWQRLETITSFFAGSAAEPGPLQYAAALEPPGKASRLPALADASAWERFRDKLMQFVPRPLFANSSPFPAELVGPRDLRPGPNTGFRLLSQRFALDAFALGKLVYPNIGPGTNAKAFTAIVRSDGSIIRGVPRGLDLMALLPFAGLPYKLLYDGGDTAYVGNSAALSYYAAHDDLQVHFQPTRGPVEWNRDQHMAWLYVLSPLVQSPLMRPSLAGLPTFMKSPTYQVTKLNTALASWTQLRSDTVLYTRKADSGAETARLFKFKDNMALVPAPKRHSEPLTYLEPLPGVYEALQGLTRMVSKELTALDALTPDWRQRLDELDQHLTTAGKLAWKEINNDPLSAEEQDALRRLPERLQLLTGAVSTPVIVTVAEDAAGAWVLQEATGRPDLGLFVVRLPSGQLVTFAGPMLCYFEMKLPRAQALTQERWLKLLDETPGPSRPEWSR